MVKILSQTGISLADIYNIKGSIVGVDQLLATEVQTVHEMGATIFSERLSASITRVVTGNIAQGVAFNVISGGFPTVPVRINGITVFTDTIARLDRIMVGLHDPAAGAERDMPLFVWNSAVDAEIPMQIQDDGAAVASVTLLRPLQALANLPTFLIGTDQPLSIPNLVIRGTTLAFGAGTVEAVVVASVVFSQIGGISSYGLPIPSW